MSPTKSSRSRIKRLRGLDHPQYRLRIGGIRVFYDVSDTTVEIIAIIRKTEAEAWLIRYGSRARRVPLSELRGDISHLLREAEKGDIVITRRGRPAGVLIGFASEDDWFDYRLENDPRFLRGVARARASLRAGLGVRLEDVDDESK